MDPINIDPTADIRRNDSISEPMKAAEEKLRILIVDDEPEIVEEVCELLDDAGFDCDGVSNAADAIDKIQSDATVSVIVTDLKMPGMDGLEMIQFINDTLPESREVAVIVVTGHAGTQEAIEALRLGAREFLTKPLSPDHLVHAVGRAAETIRLRRLDRLFHQRLQQQVLERTAEIQKLSSDLLRANQDLQKSNEELETVNRVKSEFLSLISHELRTPLNAIIGFSELMAAESAAGGKPKVENFNENVAAAGKKLLRIVETILELVDIRSGGLVINKADTDLEALIGQVVAAQKAEIEAKSIDLIIEKPEHPLVLHGDGLRLAQAIGNVLTNAIQFSEPNGQVCLAVKATGGEIKFTILDTGKGMTAAEIAIAVEPFRQADGSLAKSHYGLGLGLTLSRLIFELHGGRLEIESAPGEGTTVTMWLPAAEASDD